MHIDRFDVTPVQAAELDSAIAALSGRGVAMALLIMPFAATYPAGRGVERVPRPPRRGGPRHGRHPARRRRSDLAAASPRRRTHLDPAGTSAFTAALAPACATGYSNSTAPSPRPEKMA